MRKSRGERQRKQKQMRQARHTLFLNSAHSSICVSPLHQRSSVLRPLCSVIGPESPPHSDSEASDHGDAAPLEQQEQAAPRKPSVEREDWMTKAMPKAMPEEQEEKDEPAKKVT